jgi:uncharacterized protein YndB with AHSA1/START domain
MSRLLLPLLLGLVTATSLGAQVVSNTSFAAPDGSRVLQQSLVVPATRVELWDAFTTTDGIRNWAAPVVRADFRLGGIWESSYSLKAKIGDPGNIKNRYVSYVPLRMVSIQAIAAPPNFPSRELLAEIVTVIELDSLAARQTRVTISMAGYKTGAGYDTIYRHFEAGNAWSLQKLSERFVKGPVDWPKLLSSPARPGKSR